ncbi:hypothetical protein BI312_14840 [Xanthomonas citri pv. citri]|nr:hypothetical protein CLM98_01935 [Xanthomonas citri pv. citri]OLR72294.1 hypothetical protein BI312_14840 [Xanthomonas citri pv. citri]OLR75542.1 hypothetical protein BI311_08200 [Xanthomonas citri pv. citri]
MRPAGARTAQRTPRTASVSVSVSVWNMLPPSSPLRHRPQRPLGLTTTYAIIDDRPICSSTLVPNSPRHAHSVPRALS